MRRMGRLPLIAILVFAMLAPLGALGQGADDPFLQRHAELLRAADAQLELLRTQETNPGLQQATPASQQQGADVAASVLAGISRERVERAQKKLLALGVDAARILAEEGVPRQLLVVAEVESGFDPSALSVKGARGLWQFMPETARRYGLRVDERMDERLHAARSTRAAARYLRDLYLLFGDWQLALAAYNAGEQRITAAIERASSRSLADLVRMLPGETQLYVPAVIGPDRPSRSQ